ncbi:threonine dehydratase [Krasilnikovia cinnamomea]|uniref:Threonine dehydratase n=1 Tax=Krasilnikovia cinnamomea TaxID=349313 RepID=A0A4V2G727_9ACTN|nr:pyridoxal-phosphate dependent enzyme [Krasilnikovia cinnamomea]RZU50936.1 threonine dehydratase [Krasilnikovia cinnamomea]
MTDPMLADALARLAAAPLADGFAEAVAAAAGMRGEFPASLRDRLLAQAGAKLDAERESVADEMAYCAARVLVDRLGGTADVPYLPGVRIDARARVLGAFFPTPRRAAVALPVVGTGPAARVLVIRRSDVNGHTGAPMNDAGEIALFGGAAEPGEPPAITALREFGEEAGLGGADADPRLDPWLPLGDWLTEGGYTASGFVLRATAPVLADVRPDPREVSAVGRLPLDALFDAEPVVRPHLRIGLARGRRPVFVGWFDSPTFDVVGDDGRVWQLFGLAGAMTAALRHRFVSAAEFAAAQQRRATVRARRAPAADPLGDHLERAFRVRAFLRRDLAVPAAPVIAAPLLSEVLEEPAALVLDATLPLGGSTKARVVAGASYATLESAAERGEPTDLATRFAGVTLLAASTGSHARSVAALADLLRRRGARDVTCEFFVSADIPASKLELLTAAGTVVRCADFNDATDRAVAREAELSRQQRPAVFLACDPDHRLNTAFGLSGMDGAAGFATLLLDVVDAVRNDWAALGLAEPRVGELWIPTSGGATLSACTALLTRLPGGPVDAITGVYDVAAPCLPHTLSAGGPAPVDWRHAINGLAQPHAAPGAVDVLRATPVPLLGVSLAAARLAQPLIALDAGLWPEPAGAASVGARLVQAFAAGGPEFGRRLVDLVSKHPSARFAADVGALAAAVQAGSAPRSPAVPRQARAYLVTGAAGPQPNGLRRP